MLKIFEVVADDSHLVVPQMTIAHHVIAELINTRGIKADGKPTRSKHVKAVLVGEVPIKDAVKPYVNLSDKDKIPGVLVPTKTKDGKLFVDKEVMQPQVEAANRMAKELIGIKKEAKQLLNKKKSERMKREYAEKAKQVEGSEVAKKPELGEELGAMFKEANRIGKKYQDEPEAAKQAETIEKEASPGLNLDLPDVYFNGKYPSKYSISKKVWDSFSANEQDLIRILVRRQNLNPIKSFIKGMRDRFGGVENVTIVQMGKVIDPKTPDQIHLWDGEDKKWHSFPLKKTATPTPSNAKEVVDATEKNAISETSPAPAKQAKEAASEAATKPKPTNAKQVKEAAAETLPPEPERMQTDLFGAATPVPKAPKNASNKRFSPEMLEYANKVLDDARQKVMKHDKLVEQWQPSKRAKALKETADKLNRFQTMNSSQLEYELSRDPSMKKYFEKLPTRLTPQGKQLVQDGLKRIKQSDIDSAQKVIQASKNSGKKNQEWYDAYELIHNAAQINSISAAVGQDEPFKVPSSFEEPRPNSLWVNSAGYERTPHFDKVLKAARNKLANLPKSETEPPDFPGKITVDLTKFGGAKYEVEPTIKPKKVGNKEIPGGIPQFQEWLNKDKTIKYDFGKPSAPSMPKGNPQEWEKALKNGDIDKATYDLLMNTEPKAPKKQTTTKEASPQKNKKPNQSKMSKKESSATTTTKEIKFANVKEIGAHDPTPLGKIKVYADSDLNFFRTTPRKIVWEKDGNVTTAYFPVNEAKSTQPNYKINTNSGESRSVPVFQVLKSLNANPPTEIIKFDLADFVRPKG